VVEEDRSAGIALAADRWLGRGGGGSGCRLDRRAGTGGWRRAEGVGLTDGRVEEDRRVGPGGWAAGSSGPAVAIDLGGTLWTSAG
jgi:hypothetical protein